MLIRRSLCCLRFVDLTFPKKPHIEECLINLLNLERATACDITQKILDSLTHPSVSLRSEVKHMMELQFVIFNSRCTS